MQKFTPSGERILRLEFNGGPTGVAVDQANGDVYVSMSGEVEVFDADGNFLNSFSVLPEQPGSPSTRRGRSMSPPDANLVPRAWLRCIALLA